MSKWRPRKGEIVNDALAHPSANISKKNHETLKNHSFVTKIPIAKLLAIALDNELDQSTPFAYDLAPSKTEGNFDDAAGRLYRYMRDNFVKGTDLMQLVLCRGDYGVESKNDAIMAHKILMDNEMIEEISVLGSTFYRLSDSVRQQQKYDKQKALEAKGPL